MVSELWFELKFFIIGGLSTYTGVSRQKFARYLSHVNCYTVILTSANCIILTLGTSLRVTESKFLVSGLGRFFLGNRCFFARNGRLTGVVRRE